MLAAQKELRSFGDKSKGEFLRRFFKTGKGEYAHGDVFLGITVPQTRAVAKKYSGIPLSDVQKIISSKFHEERLLALLILVQKFSTGNELERKIIFDFYFDNMRFVNNWDLVDLSAGKIVGEYLRGKEKAMLRDLACSGNLWERRIAIVSTFDFIKKNSFEEAFAVSELLLNDKHDLIHKAVGWMLREAGKRDQKAEERFLKKHYKKMPRTMLRYAIERFPEKKRKAYLAGKI